MKAERYDPAKTMKEAEAIMIMALTVTPENLKDVRCYMEDGRRNWLMEWRTDVAKVRYERRGVEGDKPILLFPEDEAKGYIEHFYVHDYTANAIAVIGSLRLDTLSFFAQSVANRLAEDLEDMFHGI